MFKKIGQAFAEHSRIEVRNELSQLRIELRNELTQLQVDARTELKESIAQLIQDFDLRQRYASQNIELELQHRALRSTAEYVETHMADVLSLASKHELLTHALGHITLPGGLFCEFGVFSGGTINYIADQVPGPVFGFDSFEGLPERWQGQDKGRFAVEQLPEVRSNVRLIRGWFNETLPGFIAENDGPVAFLHVDCDLYSSTKTIFDQLRTRIIPGTVIVFDEYFNYSGWQQGEFKAFRELIQASGLGYDYIGYHRFGEQVAVKLRKLN